MSDTPSTIIDELDPASTVLATDLLYIKDASGNDLKATMQQVKDFTMPDPASVNTSGLVNTAAQSFSGKKTFTNGVAASSAEISGNETVGGNLDVSGEITQNGQPLITDVEISEEEGNALEKKEDGLYVDASSSWTGTQEEFDALDKSTLKDGQQINILDDNANYAGVDRVIENGHNENGYYRKWESGLIEQWGSYTGTSNNYSFINFPIAFSNTSYNLNLTSGSAIAGGVCLAYNEKNTDKVKIYNYQAPNGDWYAMGY